MLGPKFPRSKRIFSRAARGSALEVLFSRAASGHGQLKHRMLTDKTSDVV
jgi:hypothetical protein